MDLYPGILPPPGNAIVKELFLYQDARENAVTGNGRVEIHAHTISYTDAVFAAYVTRVSVLGAYWAFGTIQMLRISSQSLAGCGKREIFERIGPRAAISATGEHSNHD